MTELEKIERKIAKTERKLDRLKIQLRVKKFTASANRIAEAISKIYQVPNKSQPDSDKGFATGGVVGGKIKPMPQPETNAIPFYFEFGFEEGIDIPPKEGYWIDVQKSGTDYRNNVRTFKGRYLKL